MKMDTKEIEAFLSPIAERVGVEIVETHWDARKKTLTIYIDKEGGMDLLTCETFHRAIDEPLDELDPSHGEPYTVTCSSPGLDRPFRTARDFEKHLGEKIEVHLYAPIEGKKYYEGVLEGFDGKTVTFGADGKQHAFPFEKCSKICLLIEV